MKVIHLACVAPPEIGGIGNVAAFEVKQLRARGVDASLVSPTTHRVLWRCGNAAALDLRPLMEDLRKAVVVHLHYPFYDTARIVARLRVRGVIKRLVVTLHMDATSGGLRGALFDLHRAFAQPRILKMADTLLVSSLDYARHSSFAPFADRCIELPFGVDEQRFAPDPVQSRLSGARGGESLLFVGGMDRAHPFKGVEVLLRAIAQMPQHVTLTLVGDGDLRSRYEKLSRELGIESHVNFLGRVSDMQLPDLYRHADVFVFPSTSGAEAFGLAALEAQSCGVPVVASDLPGVRIVVAHGETGFLVPPKDVKALAERLAFLLEHPEVRHAMGTRARLRVLARFTQKKHIDGLIAVYADVL